MLDKNKEKIVDDMLDRGISIIEISSVTGYDPLELASYIFDFWKLKNNSNFQKWYKVFSISNNPNITKPITNKFDYINLLKQNGIINVEEPKRLKKAI